MLLATALLVFGSVAFRGVKTGAERLRSSLAIPAEVLFPEELLKIADQADRALPPGEPAFYVCGDADTWNCGLWQRLLYPRPVFCLRKTNPRHAQIYRDLVSRFNIRYAIGDVAPPPELVLVRKTDLAPSHWIGEIAP
jgi:hypothetical protein